MLWPMTALEAVSVYLPPLRIPIESLAGPSGLTEMQVKRSVRRWWPSLDC
jgi:hypothetical protein